MGCPGIMAKGDNDTDASDGASVALPGPAARNLVFRRIHPDEEVICNEDSGTVHCLDVASESSACGWRYGVSKPRKARDVLDDDSLVWFARGASACCGRRIELSKALMPM